MKKALIIISSILLMIFLIVNGIRMQSGKVDSEKEWYVEQLHFDFSGKIDSVKMLNQHVGRLQFHLTRGNIDKSVEENLSKQLKHSGDLIFLHGTRQDNLIIISRMADKGSPGDSLYVNTDKNQVIVYRNGLKVFEQTVTGSLSGRPF